MVYTYTRYNDSNAVFRFDIDVVSVAGAGTITTLYYVLEPDFNFSREMLDYGRFIETNIVQYNEGAYN